MLQPPARVTTSEALELIDHYFEAGISVFGVEGFVIVPEGYIADLDLIFDVSDTGMPVRDAATAAKAFVKARDRPNVVWEVWADD